MTDAPDGEASADEVTADEVTADEVGAHEAPPDEVTVDVPICAACRAIDRADGIEDGHVWNPEHYVTDTSRNLFSSMRRLQDHTADTVTRFAGSMRFVWIHVAWFGVWIAINVGLAGLDREFDEFPFGLLTMIVSLEAIFLSTFVMISQNRQAVRSELRSQIDLENNVRSEIWAVHIGQALGIDVDHVEDIVSRAIAGIQAATSAEATLRPADRK